MRTSHGQPRGHSASVRPSVRYRLHDNPTSKYKYGLFKYLTVNFVEAFPKILATKMYFSPFEKHSAQANCCSDFDP